MMSFSNLLVVLCLTFVAFAAEKGHPDVTYSSCEPTDSDPDADCIFGRAGSDYPILNTIPNTNFPCRDHLPGIYADPEAFCQVYHMCLHDGTRHSFLCPNGTLFNQAYFVCDLWFNVDCTRAVQFYQLNENLYKTPQDSIADTNF